MDTTSDTASSRGHRTGVKLTLMLSAQETAGALSVAELILPPFFRHSATRRSLRSTDVIRVVAGTLAITVDDRTTTAEAGEVIVVPAGTRYRGLNPTCDPTVVLLARIRSTPDQRLAAGK